MNQLTHTQRRILENVLTGHGPTNGFPRTPLAAQPIDLALGNLFRRGFLDLSRSDRRVLTYRVTPAGQRALGSG